MYWVYFLLDCFLIDKFCKAWQDSRLIFIRLINFLGMLRQKPKLLKSSCLLSLKSDEEKFVKIVE